MNHTGQRKDGLAMTLRLPANGAFGSPMILRLAATIAALVFAVPTAALAAGASPAVKTAASKPTKLEGMAYGKARRIILGYGWKPSSDHCYAGTDACARYPEIDSCTYSFPILCAMDFARDGKCLMVDTSGEAAPGEGLEDPIVTDVTFLKGPCPKI
ncbi:MAG TPA: hypothetical protein VJQ06_10280 [Rhizomicrobium sp.]|nr:hypothetical protein [Rhizomicrobium sp.]